MFRIFFTFSSGGREGEEESEAKRGCSFSLKMDKGRGSPRRGGGVVHTAAGRVSQGGRGVYISPFRGRNVHQVFFQPRRGPHEKATKK